MTLLLPFAITLFIAALISGLAQRTILSTAVLFLLAGILLGRPGFDLLNIQPDDALVTWLVQLALFSVLFDDGMRAGIHDLLKTWRLPGRALLLGFPLTFALMALLGRFLLGLSWIPAFLLAAALSPTDPVFASALMGHENVPLRLRRLLNVESGLNDALALPILLLTLSAADTGGKPWNTVLANLGLGFVVGVGVPLFALGLQKILPLSRSEQYRPLGTVAIGLIILALGLQENINLYLAAFAAGITIVTVDAEAPKGFQPFGALAAELFKLAALLVFGGLISLEVVSNHFSLAEYLFIALALLAVRPIALLIALYGTNLERREWLTVAWFGPKGFASMIYGLLILNSGISQGPYLFHLIAFIIALSIIAHSSTDVLIARRFDPRQQQTTPNHTPPP